MFEPAKLLCWDEIALRPCTEREMRYNGYSLFTPPGLGMSHNRRTLRDVGPLVSKVQPTRQNGGVALRMVAVVTPEVEAGMWPPATHFAIETMSWWRPVRPTFQQPAQRKRSKNETAGLKNAGRS